MADTDTASTDGAGTPEPTKKAGRAGRNLPAAIGVGAFLGFGVIAILVFAPLGWVPVVAVAMAVATHEVVKRLRTAGYSIPIVPLLVGGQAMVWLTWPFGPAGALGAFGATVVVCMIWRLLSGGMTNAPVNYLRDVTTTIFLAAWIPLFGAFGVLLVYPEDGRWRVLCLMLGVVFSDIGGYAAGVLFGKHPMVPAISPKKSWEGFAGSLIFGTAASVLAVAFLLEETGLGRHSAGSDARRDRHARRPHRVSGQARPWHQGHGHPATRPRRADGPARLGPAVGRRDVGRPDASCLTGIPVS